MARDKVLHVRISEEEHRKLAKMAAGAGTTKGWLLRALIQRSELVQGAVLIGVVNSPLPPEREAAHA